MLQEEKVPNHYPRSPKLLPAIPRFCNSIMTLFGTCSPPKFFCIIDLIFWRFSCSEFPVVNTPSYQPQDLSIYGSVTGMVCLGQLWKLKRAINWTNVYKPCEGKGRGVGRRTWEERLEHFVEMGLWKTLNKRPKRQIFTVRNHWLRIKKSMIQTGS